MNLPKNLLRDEYEQLGGPKLSENSSVFLNKLWNLLVDNKKSSIFEATIEAGFDEDNDEEMFIPLCERLLAMGLLAAYTELNYDEFRENIVEGSLKQGINSADDYSEEERKKLNLEKNEAKYVSVTVFLAASLSKKLAQLKAAIAEPEKVQAKANEEDEEQEELLAPQFELEDTAEEEVGEDKSLENDDEDKESNDNNLEAEEFEERISSLKKTDENIDEKVIMNDNEEIHEKNADYQEEEAQKEDLDNSNDDGLAQKTSDEERRNEIVSLGKTRAKDKKWAIAAAGLIITTAVAYFSIKQYSQISDKTQKIEEHYETPSKGMRLVSIKELDDTKQEIANVRAKNAAMGKEAEAAIEANVSKAMKNAEEEALRREKIAYEKGQNDAMGISESLKDKVLMMSTKMAVVKGECEGLGRGNRIDRVFPPTLPVKVRGYLIDPDTKSIIGIEADNEQLLARADGPITMIRCYKGKADIWPSFDTPFVGNDGLAKPINQNGQTEETNPLLK